MDSFQESHAPGIRPPGYALPASAHVGRVRLAVSDLRRSLAFYSDILGLAVLHEEDRFAQLGTLADQKVLLELQQLDGVRPIGHQTRLGLFHVAFLLPERTALSEFVRHLINLNVPFSAGDHNVSEAIYLSDPDGLNVEVYADRSVRQWPVRNREILLATKPVQIEQLLSISKRTWKGAPSGTTMGHVHLYVQDLERAEAFYHSALGLSKMTWAFPGALFLAAGSYHHHVGLNIWAAESPLAGVQDARMLFWELVLPTAQDLEKVAASLSSTGWTATTSEGILTFADPWGINLALATEDANQGRNKATVSEVG